MYALLLAAQAQPVASAVLGSRCRRGLGDLHEEVMLRLIERLRRLRQAPTETPIADFRSYAAAVTWHVLAEHRENGRRERQRFEQDRGDDVLTRLPDPRADAVSDLELRTQLTLLWQEIRRLPPGDNVARGYITMDTVNACSSYFPNDPHYFGGIVTNKNTLRGDWYHLRLGLLRRRHRGHPVRQRVRCQPFDPGTVHSLISALPAGGPVLVSGPGPPDGPPDRAARTRRPAPAPEARSPPDSGGAGRRRPPPFGRRRSRAAP